MIPRLTTTRQFDAVYREGVRARDKTLRVAVRPNGLDRWRLGMAVSRKVGGAVARNAARRRLREIFRHDILPLSPPSDLVVSINPGADTAYASLRTSLLDCVGRALGRTGGGRPASKGRTASGKSDTLNTPPQAESKQGESDCGIPLAATPCAPAVYTMRRIYLLPVYFYRLTLSPLVGRQCRFHPTCSRYFIDAVLAEGIVRGTLKGAWRIARCNPLCRGGHDPVKRHPEAR